MAEPVFIIGRSGSGKSSSIEPLDSDTTFVISVSRKRLPFKSSGYYETDEKGKVGNYLRTKNPGTILQVIKDLPVARKHIKEIVIDDAQYIMGFTYIDRVRERKYYDKFNDILSNINHLMEAIFDARDDLIVYLTFHEEVTEEGIKKAKTVGKAVDKYLTLEGLVSTVLWSKIDHNPGDPPTNEYYFETQSDGTNTAKSPKGMLDFRVPNDLSLVSKAIREYYRIA